MKVATHVSDTFQCSLERAFKAPILGDATQFLTGYLLQPGVSDFEKDKTWGRIGGVRYPVTQGNWLIPKGRMAKDEVLERIENQYWKWTLYDFEVSALFFVTNGIGEWTVKESEDRLIGVKYTYTYHSRNWLMHPLNWLFVKIQIRGMMKKAIKGIKQQAESNAPFIYDK